jgi:hypothetical protein
MPFGLTSDDFYDHPKVVDAPDSAIALWTRAQSYCMRHLTDGRVTDRQARRLCDNPEEGIKYLIESGLWERDDTGYRFHDWADYNPSRADILAKRADNAARQQAFRDRKKAARGQRLNPSRRDEGETVAATDDVTNGEGNAPRNDTGNASSNDERNALRNGGVTAPQFPVPRSQIPVPKEEVQTLFPIAATPDGGSTDPNPAPATNGKIPDAHRFDEFWNAYPHKRDKDAARKAWVKVVRDSARHGADVDLDDVIAAAGFYRHSREFVGGFAKYPATFLNKGSWRDFAAGPPTEQAAPVKGFDARAAEFDAMRDRLRTNGERAAELIQPVRQEITRGATDA